MDPRSVFSIRTKKEFEKKALEIFRYQSGKNPVYQRYLSVLGRKVSDVHRIDQVPFLPIEFFKQHEVVTSEKTTAMQTVFLSSGTTGMERSRHIVRDVSLYEESFRLCFESLYGDIRDYAILALLPSYYGNKQSSLLYMVMDMIRRSGHPKSTFYNGKDETLIQDLLALKKKKQKIILIGVAFALLDFPLSAFDGSGFLTVVETGGMKGRKEEITREELHQLLTKKFGVKKIHSEYGMTELLSQAWSKGDGLFQCPPWMRVLARDINDPFSPAEEGKTGILNIIDLANVHSCSFIATQDLGRVFPDGRFEVLGRADHADLRGCSLMVL